MVSRAFEIKANVIIIVGIIGAVGTFFDWLVVGLGFVLAAFILFIELVFIEDW